MTERCWLASGREERQPQIELHRRVIEARNQARIHETNSLLSRITATLSTG